MKHLIYSGLFVLVLCFTVCSSQEAKPKSACKSETCNPKWLRILNMQVEKGVVNYKKGGILCTFIKEKGLFSPCSLSGPTSQAVCPNIANANLTFNCCPTSCIPDLMNCSDRPAGEVTAVCVPPKILKPWIKEILTMLKSKKTNQKILQGMQAKQRRGSGGK